MGILFNECCMIETNQRNINNNNNNLNLMSANL